MPGIHSAEKPLDALDITLLLQEPLLLGLKRPSHFQETVRDLEPDKNPRSREVSNKVRGLTLLVVPWLLRQKHVHIQSGVKSVNPY